MYSVRREIDTSIFKAFLHDFSQVDGVRGLAPRTAIRETRKLVEATFDVPIGEDLIPSPPVEPSPQSSFVENSPPATADPLEELLKAPVDPGLLDSFLNPSSTVGPDYATASVPDHGESGKDGAVPAAVNNLEPSPVVQSSVDETATSMETGASRTVGLSLLGDKFMDDEDFDDDGDGSPETDVKNEDDADGSSEAPNLVEEKVDEAPVPNDGDSVPETDPKTVVQEAGDGNVPLMDPKISPGEAEKEAEQPPPEPRIEEERPSGTPEASQATEDASNLAQPPDNEKVTCTSLENRGNVS